MEKVLGEEVAEHDNHDDNLCSIHITNAQTGVVAAAVSGLLVGGAILLCQEYLPDESFESRPGQKLNPAIKRLDKK